MSLPNIPQSEALVPLAPLAREPFPDEVPEEFLAGLPLRDRRFLLDYIETGNAANAYKTHILRKEDGEYHPNAPYAMATTHLRKPRIQAALARIQAFFAYHTGLHAWEILGTLHAQATLDPVDIYERNGESWEMKPMAEWPAHVRRCVQKVSIKEWQSEGGTKRQIDVEFTDRQHALFLLGKHLKLYEKQNRQVAPFTLVLNTNAPDPHELMAKRVGEVIEGIGLKIHMPEPEQLREALADKKAP